MKHGKNWQRIVCLLCVVLSAVLLSACGDRFGKAYEEDIYPSVINKIAFISVHADPQAEQLASLDIMKKE